MSDEITGFPDHYIVNGDPSECPCPGHTPKPAREELERLAALVGSPEYSLWYRLLLDRYKSDLTASVTLTAFRLVRSHALAEAWQALRDAKQLDALPTINLLMKD